MYKMYKGAKGRVIFILILLSFISFFLIKNIPKDFEIFKPVKENHELSEVDNSKQAFKDILYVYKTETCECCLKWINYLELKNVNIKTITVKYSEIQEKRNFVDLPEDLYSCHSSEFGPYFLEGHIPFEAIQYLDENKPDWIGISVPAMPLGSPGMEIPGYTNTDGDQFEKDLYKVYEVFAFFKRDKKSKIEKKSIMKFKGLKKL